MQAILAQHIPTLFAPGRGLFDRIIRRLFGPAIPAVGETFSFVVTADHWLRAKESCRLTGSRSTHCVLAQAIAERLRLPFVSVGADGVVQAAFDQTEDLTDALFFRVDRAGVKIISRFDSFEDGVEDPTLGMPNNFPFEITATRYGNYGDVYAARPAETDVVIA